LKHEIIKLLLDIVFMLSITYIFGQAGALEQGKISISPAIVRLAAGVAVLGFAATIANKFWKEEKEKAHKGRQSQVSAKQKNHIYYNTDKEKCK
jgi:hypothetical protein